jgi:hypothetical protein
VIWDLCSPGLQPGSGCHAEADTGPCAAALAAHHSNHVRLRPAGHRHCLSCCWQAACTSCKIHMPLLLTMIRRSCYTTAAKEAAAFVPCWTPECLDGQRQSSVACTYHYQSTRPQVFELEDFVNHLWERITCERTRQQLVSTTLSLCQLHAGWSWLNFAPTQCVCWLSDGTSWELLLIKVTSIQAVAQLPRVVKHTPAGVRCCLCCLRPKQYCEHQDKSWLNSSIKQHEICPSSSKSAQHRLGSWGSENTAASATAHNCLTHSQLSTVTCATRPG